MSEWTHRAVIVVPIEHITLANAVAKAFDPDTGGALSFNILRCGSPATHAVCDTPLIEATANVFVNLQGNPALLHQMCVADYADRWPELNPPSLNECEQFLSAVQMTVELRGRDVTAVLSEMGFALTPEQSPP